MTRGGSQRHRKKGQNVLFVPRSIQNTQIPYDHNVEVLNVKPCGM